MSTRITYSGSSSGWLEASLAQPTAPTTLTLKATTAGLASDTYQAVVAVLSTSVANGPLSLAVEFVVGSPALRAPALQSATVSGTQVTLSWTFSWPSALGGNDEYELEKSSSSASGFALVGSYECTTSACRQNPFTATRTESPGTYYYRVRARTSVGASGYSQVQSAVVAAASITRFVNSSVYSLVSIRVDEREYITASGNAVD
ncbi:MAG TPA: fibronectin type III domain-containing protein, partial [Vicinamibacteria bacterium]|nr:fibronectin type III domain-containing protein [Vicinamibacteria bacterium]